MGERSASQMEAVWNSPVMAGLVGSLVAGLATGVGALLVFFRRDWSTTGQALMLAVAGGIMLAASIFSLMIPALDLATERTGNVVTAAAVVSGGILLGALTIWLIHSVVPHEHFMKGPEGGSPLGLGRNWLLILAITLHNVPEGMSVGVAFGPGDVKAGWTVATGIALQNVPEGLAVAAALLGEGFSRQRAFTVALLTGLVEPVAGLFGALVVSLSTGILPVGLAFAAGAMLFVIAGEVIPETYRDDRRHRATMTFVSGFLIMMMLDVSLG